MEIKQKIMEQKQPNEKLKKIIRTAIIILGGLILILLWNIFSADNKGIAKNQKMSDMSLGEAAPGFMPSPSAQLPSEGASRFSMEESESVSGSVMPESDASSDVPLDKKVIKNGNLDLRVQSTERAAKEVGMIAKNQGGEVFSTNFRERVKGQKSGFMTVKVPVLKFEETMEKLKAIATQVVSESTTGQDVTEQYADLQVQLRNKKVEEESFVKILDRAGKIDDVLATTRQIARVRGEIERLEGRIRFMESQTDMSTITVSLSEDTEIAPVSKGWRPWEVVKKSAKELVVNIQGFVDGLIRFVIVGIPSLLPLVVIAWFVYWIGKKIVRKMHA